MKKMLSLQALAVLAFLVAALTPYRAEAQQSAASRFVPPQHLAADAMSASDAATLQANMRELIRAARIYGYNLEEGNWAYEQTLCTPMPGTILLHYLQQFPDGTSSLFTALVPRQSGRVRIVPVLHRNAEPFMSPAKSPRNYALFNELVPSDIARNVIASKSNGLQLSVCYAEMAGGRTNVPEDSGIAVAIAGAPMATVSLNPKDNTTRITFASREGDSTYRVWSVSFNKDGRVTAAGSEDHTVYTPKMVAQPQAVATATLQPSSTAPAKEEVARGTASGQIANSPVPAAEEGNQPAITPPVENSAGVSERSAVQLPEQSSEPGWKLVTNPAEPASTVTPPAPAPPEKITPTPPGPEDWNTREDQTPN